MHKNVTHYGYEKTCDSAFIHDFYNCWSIFKILSLPYLKQTLCHISDRTINVSLHYIAELIFNHFG